MRDALKILIDANKLISKERPLYYNQGLLDNSNLFFYIGRFKDLILLFLLHRRQSRALFSLHC